MLSISSNRLLSHSTQFLQQTFIDSLTPLHKIVAAIALGAIGAFVAYLVVHFTRSKKQPDATTTLAQSAIPYKPPVVTPEAFKSYTQGIKTFSFEMLKQTASQPNSGNTLISPISVSLLLSMIKHGISQTDQAELDKILHLPSDENELKGCADLLMKQLINAGFDVANLVYINDRYQLNPTYQHEIAHSYHSKVECGSSAAEINAWTNRVTHGQIKEIVDQNELNNFFVALLNAMHFNGKWSHSFDEKATTRDDFRTDPTQASSTVKVNMMHDVREVNYFENNVCQAIRLPYRSLSNVQMLCILPKEDAGSPSQPMLSSIDEALFDEMNTKMSYEKVKIALPKFDLSHEVQMVPLLNQMGLTNLFKQPDFSPLVDKNHGPSLTALPNLRLTQVKQKSALKIDETRTVASTATLAEVACMYEPPGEKKAIPEITFDRPFLALLVQDRTPMMFAVVKNPNG